MTAIATILCGLAILIGAGFTVVAAVGLVRLPDLFTRMHAASKAGTMGACVVFIAAAVGSLEAATIAKACVGVVFFLLTAPISAHLLAKAARGAGQEPWRSGDERR